MEQYWDKPLEFMPERWLDPEKTKERHPYLFIPFQGTFTSQPPRTTATCSLTSPSLYCA
jgi:hypothetical protein